MFSKLKIKGKLFLSFGVVLLLTIIIFAFSVLSLRNANNSLNEFMSGVVAADDTMKDSSICTNTAARYLRDLVLEDNEANYDSLIEKANANIATIQENEATLRSLEILSESELQEYEKLLEDWFAIGERVISLVESGDKRGAEEVILKECTPALEQVSTMVEKLSDDTAAMRTETLEKNLRVMNSSIIFMTVIALIAIIIAIFIAIKVTAQIVRPVNQIVDAMKGISEGRMSQNLSYESQDEIGELVKCVQHTSTGLEQVVSDLIRLMDEMAKGNFAIAAMDEIYQGDFQKILSSIREMNHVLSTTLSRIDDASQQVASGADQVSSGSQTLSQGATEQASSVEELAATINDISAQVSDTAVNAKEASQKVLQAQDALSVSNQQMQAMITAMEEISQKSGEIEKIIKTIEDIAFQTNILALNAAVEAARAGEAGKGFAVVADEVRNLASKSAEAANHTTALIEGTIQAVNNGTSIVDQTAKALRSTVESTKSAVEYVDKISKAADDQAASISQVTIGMDQISSVIQTNSATAQQSAAASEELSGQSQLLKGLVSGFKLRDVNHAAEYEAYGDASADGYDIGIGEGLPSDYE